jgi:hypothetical protein
LKVAKTFFCFYGKSFRIFKTFKEDLVKTLRGFPFGIIFVIVMLVCFYFFVTFLFFGLFPVLFRLLYIIMVFLLFFFKRGFSIYSWFLRSAVTRSSLMSGLRLIPRKFRSRFEELGAGEKEMLPVLQHKVFVLDEKRFIRSKI